MVGGQADIAHQIVQDLRGGSYEVSQGQPVSFARVALVGHSVGGAIARVEAYSFHDIGALGVISYADLGQSVLALGTLAGADLGCVLGGEHSDGAAGYAPLGTTASDFDAAMFYDAAPEVVAPATATRNPGPCGDDVSLAQTIGLDQLLLPTIHVPALLLYGAYDALFPRPRGLCSACTSPVPAT